MKAAVSRRSAGARTRSESVITAVLLAGACVVPLIVSESGYDVFRVPKTAVLEAEAILLAALLAITAIYRGAEPFRELWRTQRPAVAIALGAVMWTAIASAASTNRPLSASSLLWVASCATIFIATLLVARSPSPLLLLFPLGPAVINAALAILQRANWYNPLTFDAKLSLHNRTTALIGNPNDVASYLLFPAIVAIVMMTLSSAGTRIAWGAVAAILVGGVVASESVTGVIALAAACAALTALVARRPARTLGIIAAAALVVVIVYTPLRVRAVEIARLARSGHVADLTSGRLPAYLVAARIFADHPITGAGPGCFGFSYFPYKLALNNDYPEFFKFAENFGEAHNDHLQTLAVSGIFGYALFVAAVVVLAMQARRGEGFGKRAGLPLAIGFSVATLAQFPLELASSMSVILHFAALAMERAES
jgi:O-antigen ligase